MELLDFFKVLRQRKYILLVVALLSIGISYLVVSNLPDKYVSHSTLATGLADNSRQLEDENVSQDSKINQEFGNIIQMILLNKIIDQVSYKLLLHDLESKVPFKEPSRSFKMLVANNPQHLAVMLTEKHNAHQALSSINSNEKNVEKALQSMKYDDESIRKRLKVYRVENSDFINIEFESDNPQLSAFVLNTLSDEFIGYYSKTIRENKERTVVFLDSLLRIKQENLAISMEVLKDYRINNKVLDLNEQSRSIYAQMADVSTRKGIAQKDVVAYNAALKSIDRHFEPANRGYIEGSVSGLNQDIVQSKQQLRDLNESYVNSDFNPKYKTQIDSLETKLTGQIYDQTDQYAYNPLTTKENLMTQKINLEVSRDLSKNSVASFNNELGRINQGLEQLVPSVAYIKSYEANLEIANKEYIDILQRYNQASLEASYILPLRQIQKAMPENAQPDKKPLLVILSGLIALLLSISILFGMFYFDRSVYTREQLTNLTHLPTIGLMNVVHGKQINLQNLWDGQSLEEDKQLFKNSLRSMRHDIATDLHDQKVIAITSLTDGAGKTFLTTSLAYAFSKANKRVLIIDGNFLNPDISNGIRQPRYLESYLGTSRLSSNENASISVLGNKGGDSSILELSDYETLANIFAQFREMYDVILIETSTLESTNRAIAKEWIMFADKVVAVYESGQPFEHNMTGDVTYFQNLGDKFYGFILNKVVDATQVKKQSVKSRSGVKDSLLSSISLDNNDLKQPA